MKLLTYALVFVTLVTPSLVAKDVPFAGKWKLNKEQSRVTGQQMKMEDLGGKRLKFTRGNGDTDTLTMDGTDQPVHYGRTIALTSESPTSFKMVIKKDGKVLSSMTHSLSANGNTQTIKGTDYRPDGSTSDFEEVNRRVGSGSGWTGTWESTKVEFNSPDEFEIAANGNNGITFRNDSYKATLDIKFDGKSYESHGPTIPPGLTTSGKRTGERSFELTDKIKDKIVGRSGFRVSEDGKTLTIIEHDPGQPNAQTYRYDRM